MRAQQKTLILTYYQEDEGYMYYLPARGATTIRPALTGPLPVRFNPYISQIERKPPRSNGRNPKPVTLSSQGQFAGWLKGVIGRLRRQHSQQTCRSLNAGHCPNMSLSWPIN
jgi:hypothetical protein